MHVIQFITRAYSDSDARLSMTEKQRTEAKAMDAAQDALFVAALRAAELHHHVREVFHDTKGGVIDILPSEGSEDEWLEVGKAAVSIYSSSYLRVFDHEFYGAYYPGF